MSRRSRIRVISAALFGAVSAAAEAQTSGTWANDVGTAGGSWSVASNWTAGQIPGGGGAAHFVALPTFTTAPLSIFQDLPTVSLGTLTFQTLITYQLRAPAGSPTNSITLTGPGVIDTQIPSINTLSNVTFGQLLQLPITGSAGLTKRGPGTVSLWQNTNTYTGGTRVEDGVLFLRQIGDPALGDPGGSVTLAGGTIRVANVAWNTARTLEFAAGGGTIEATLSGTTSFSGPVSGNGAFNKTGVRGVNLSAVNPFSGPINVLAGSIGLAGNGTLPAVASITNRGDLILDNSTANNADRVNNAAPITSLGGGIAFTGNAGANSSETLGDLTLGRGLSTITLTPGSGRFASLEFGQIQRESGAALFVRGTALGAAPGPNATGLTFANPPPIAGPEGVPTDLPIIPWLIGNTSPTAGPEAVTTSFVTYASHGLTPLDVNTAYLTSIPGGISGSNVRVTTPQAVTTPSAVRSLIIASGGGVSGSTLTISSGALMNLSNGATLSAPLDFGSAEAMIHAPASITFSGLIAGTGGLTKHGAGVATFAAANTYTGTTVIAGGTATFGSSVLSGVPGPFGPSASAVVLAPAGVGVGGATGRIVYTGASPGTFERDLLVSGRIVTNTSATLPGFGVASGGNLLVSGDINLDGSAMTFIGGGGSTLTLDGVLSGAGPITDNSSSGGTIRLNGNNTFTEGAELAGATWQVGSDSAFGDGGLLRMVQVSGQPTILAVGGARVVTNPTVCFSFNTNYWQIAGDQPITFTGSINLSGTYTHNINNSATTTYAGVLHTGGFTKAGTGRLVLSGDNVYSGNTTISSGALRVTHPNALGSTAAPTVVAVGARLELSDGALTSEPVVIRGSGSVAHGLGAIASLSGNNSVGAITVAGDSMIVVENGSLVAGNIDRSDGPPVTPPSLTLVLTGPLTAQRVRLGQLAVDGNLVIAPGRSPNKTSRLTSLGFAPSSRMDLGDNDLVIDYTGPSPSANVRLFLSEGYNAGGWDGDFLNSSVAATTPGTALGYAETGALFTSFPATFSGQSVDDTTVVVGFTLAGDANLDRSVDIADFSRLGAHFNQPGDWIDGDFNYDGLVGIGDFSQLAANFNQSLPALGDGLRAVPEPSVVLVVGGMGLQLIRRRRGIGR